MEPANNEHNFNDKIHINNKTKVSSPSRSSWSQQPSLLFCSHWETVHQSTFEHYTRNVSGPAAFHFRWEKGWTSSLPSHSALQTECNNLWLEWILKIFVSSLYTGFICDKELTMLVMIVLQRDMTWQALPSRRCWRMLEPDNLIFQMISLLTMTLELWNRIIFFTYYHLLMFLGTFRLKWDQIYHGLAYGLSAVLIYNVWYFCEYLKDCLPDQNKPLK